MTAKEICALALDEAGFALVEDAKQGNKSFYKDQIKKGGMDGDQKSEGLGDKPFDLEAHDKQHHHGHYDGGQCKYRDEAVQKGLITKEQAQQKTGQNQGGKTDKQPPQISPEQLMQQQQQQQPPAIDPALLMQEIESGEKKVKDLEEGIKSERKNIKTAVGDIVTESALQEAVVKELDKKLQEGDARANQELEKLKNVNKPYDHNEHFNDLKEEIGSFEQLENESHDDMVDRYNALLEKIDPNEFNESERAALTGLAQFIQNRIEGGSSENGQASARPSDNQYDKETGLPIYTGNDGTTHIDSSGLGLSKLIQASKNAFSHIKDALRNWTRHTEKWEEVIQNHNSDTLVDQNRRASVNSVASAFGGMMMEDEMMGIIADPNESNENKIMAHNFYMRLLEADNNTERGKIWNEYCKWKKESGLSTDSPDGNSPSKEFNIHHGEDFNKGLPDVNAIFPEDENAGKIISSEGVQQSVDDLCQQFGIDARVGEFKDAPTSIRMQINVGKGAKISPLFNPEFKRQLNAALGADAKVTQENGSVYISFTKKKADKVFFSEAFKNPEVIQKCKEMSLPMITGKDENGNWIVEDLAKQPHQMVSGATGSGKSVDLNMALLTLMMTKTPKEAGVFIIDGKGTEFVGFKNLPHLIHPVVNGLNNTKGVKSALLSLQDEMKKRLEKLGSYKNVENWNAAHPEDKMKPIEAIIDEYSALQSADPSIQSILDDIGARARAAGIHMRLATQSPSKKLMGQLEAHFPTQHIYKAADKGSSLATMGDTRATQLLGEGDGYVKNGSSVTRMRGAFAHNDSIGRAIEHFTGEFPEEFRDNKPQKQDVIPQEGGVQKNYTVDINSVDGNPSTALQYTASNILADANNMTKAEALGRLKQAYEHYAGSVADENARTQLANDYNSMMNEMASNNSAPFKQETAASASPAAEGTNNTSSPTTNTEPPQVRPEDIFTPEQAQQLAQKQADQKKFDETHKKYHPDTQQGEIDLENQTYNEEAQQLYKSHEEGKLTGEKFRKRLQELDNGHNERLEEIKEKYQPKENPQPSSTVNQSAEVEQRLTDAGEAYNKALSDLVQAKSNGVDTKDLEAKLHEASDRYQKAYADSESKKSPQQRRDDAGRAYSKILADISKAQTENSPYLDELKKMLPIVTERYKKAIQESENSSVEVPEDNGDKENTQEEQDPLEMFVNPTSEQAHKFAAQEYKEAADKIMEDYKNHKITREEAAEQTKQARAKRDKMLGKADSAKMQEEKSAQEKKADMDAQMREEENRLRDTVDYVKHGRPVAHAQPEVGRGKKKNLTPITHQDFNAIQKALPPEFEIEGGENAMRDGSGRVWAHHKGGNGNGSRGWFDQNNQWHWAVNTKHPSYKGVNSPEAKAAKAKWLGSNLNEAQNGKAYRNIAFGTDESIPGYGLDEVEYAVLSYFRDTH